YQRKPSAAETGVPFIVPRLYIRVDDQLEIPDQEFYLDERGWSPLNFPCELSEGDFTIRETAESYEIDIRGKKLILRHRATTEELGLDYVPTNWDENQLSRWLAPRIRQDDIRHEVILEYLRRTIHHLVDKRNISLPILVRHKFLLEKAITDKVKDLREMAYAKGYQETFFGAGATIESSFEYGFKFDPNNYPARWWYKGRFDFDKQYYPNVGELNSEGEE
ncbi:unnamed protein product, partial [marine sediment metagenome]